MRRSWFFLFYLFIFQTIFAETSPSTAPLASDTPPPETRSSLTLTLQGTVFYLPRLALPQDAELLLTLNDFSELPNLLQQHRQPLLGQQVPIAFHWPLPLEATLPNIAIFQAAIINSNKIIWMSEALPLVLMPGEQDFGEIKLTAANLPALTTELYCGQEKLHLKAVAGEQRLAVSRGKSSTLDFAPLAPLPSGQGRRFLFIEQHEPWVLTENNGAFFLQNADGRRPCLAATQLPALTFAEAAVKIEIFQGDFLLTLKEATGEGQALYLSPIHSVESLVSEPQQAAGLFFHSELFDLWYYPESCTPGQPGRHITLRLSNQDLVEKMGSEKTFCTETTKPHDTPAQ